MLLPSFLDKNCILRFGCQMNFEIWQSNYTAGHFVAIDITNDFSVMLKLIECPRIYKEDSQDSVPRQTA